MALKDGFYTALGTPTFKGGALAEESLAKQIERQMAAGASGLLLMGSMGIQPVLSDEACERAARVASETVNGKTTLFVGVMDNSIVRVKKRIASLKGLRIDGVVLTTPYYFVSGFDGLVNFFTTIADESPYPLYLYDLPTVVKQKITYPMLKKLAAHKNIAGIKTADLTMILQAGALGEIKPDFTALYSGLDSVDAGASVGVRHYLDGMFACTPACTEKMEACFRAGDIPGATAKLRDIIRMRDTMAKYGIMPSFTVLMNALGFEGSFAPDYELEAKPEAKPELLRVLGEIGEL